MKNVLPVICCALLLVGGAILTAPASTTYDLPLSYTVAPLTAAATHNDAAVSGATV